MDSCIDCILDPSGTWQGKKKKENNQKSLLIEFADDTKIGGLRNNEEERSETQSKLNRLVTRWKQRLYGLVQHKHNDLETKTISFMDLCYFYSVSFQMLNVTFFSFFFF